jgi:hypothetical protein
MPAKDWAEYNRKRRQKGGTSVDRRRPGYWKEYREKQAKEGKTGPVRFRGIDGEAVRIGGRSCYVFLRMSGAEPLISNSPDKPLGTLEIFNYIVGEARRGDVIVGYVLNYDIENWLRDLPDNAYRYLAGQMEVKPEPGEDWQIPVKVYESGPLAGTSKTLRNAVIWKGYMVEWVPRKVFTLTRLSDKKQVKIQDIWGYCQASFQKAVKNWGVITEGEEKVLAEGKGSRDVFTWDELEYIKRYNNLELNLLVKLARKILEASTRALTLAETGVKATPQDMYGPGALSRKILEKMGWPESVGGYQIPAENVEDFYSTIPESFLADPFQKECIKRLPFIISYYGGRIECIGTGRWSKVYDYDLRSAYPAAISRLPTLSLEDAVYLPEVDPDILDRRLIGMYYISWDLPGKYWWCPFPFRTRTGNVFFPPAGRGWICSPEVFAALDTGFPFKVWKALVIPGTEGLGGGEKPIPDELKNPGGRICEKMFALRAETKKREGKGGAELALKLILNSMYGKLLQQVGRSLDNLGVFNDLVATWITSWTRAQIWRAIAPLAHTKQVLAIMTDGIVTVRPLDVVLGDGLGQWEVVECKDYVQLLPGLYRFKDESGKIVEKTRGMPKGFDFEEAYQGLQKGEVYSYQYRVFIGRRIWLSQHFAWKDYLYQWPYLTKEYKPDLSSKRLEMNNGKISGLAWLEGKSRRYLKPKRILTVDEVTSYPFELKFSHEFWIPEDPDLLEHALVEESLGGGNFFRE